MNNTRFQAGVHTLVVLAVWDRPTTSETISYSVDTNPVVVRRLLGDFQEAGVVRSQRGRSGGFELARSPEEITLLDVYRTVDTGPLFQSYDDYPNEECPVGCRMPEVLNDMLASAERAFEERLADVTIASLTEGIVADAEAEHGRPIIEVATEFRAQQQQT
ncbi:Rrf2 family transcriptional regulator [Halococcus saccharolyticus]|uniref:BadM/Rrf2 family transcriptional regulator n=1 Tax=Halococcus saccharolyticus DSM 5350 TaxID=1227455 RepID=M0MIC2_9EURY|nr:Rrf2 family transcriptional regulator [Halococcus saccharolyticus]EMA45088.1 BadM/Rrf2 family transcriptional regulator [Halococcus saccharolyticus DSM 5350]